MVLAPLPLGGNNPMAWTVFAVVAGLFAVLLSCLNLIRKQAVAVPFRWVWFPAVMFSGVCIWALVQSLPIVPADLRHPLWAVAAGALGEKLPGAISVNPYATGTALLRLMTYGAVFWLALQLGRERKSADLVLHGIGLAASLYALYGLVLWSTGSESILWFDKWAYEKNLTATFVNRNSFATYAGMGSVVLLALFGKSLRDPLKMRPGEAQKKRIIRFVHAISGISGVYLLALMVTMGALFLTSSRGGFGATLLALIVLLAFGLLGRRGGLAGLILAVPVVIGLFVFVFDLGGERLAERLANQGITPSSRALVYRQTVQTIADSPWLGTGYGTFRDIFPMYRDETIGLWGVWDMAHNTYLENMLELGLPAALALFLAIGALVWMCFIGALRRRRGGHFPLIGFAVSVLVAAHSLVDFSLQIPGVAITYAALLGLGVAQSWSSRKR